MNQDVWYKEGEEKFNRVFSRLYKMATRLGMMQAFYKFVFEDLKNLNNERVLDIGSGTGFVAVNLAKQKPGVSITGIDPSLHMLRIANKYARKGGVEAKVKFLQGNSRNIPISEKFDLVISTTSFHHWAEKDLAIVNVLKHLKENGEFRIYEFAKNDKSWIFRRLNSHTMSVQQFESFSKDKGYSLKSIKEDRKYILAVFSKNQDEKRGEKT